ncbi:MAG: hypothetical protein EOO06_09400 [Chitinophagaceae bacterium]|nr:MAG: hypothetical protein EOO06_09400 [Chitinophagaceae bacterium]
MNTQEEFYAQVRGFIDQRGKTFLKDAMDRMNWQGWEHDFDSKNETTGEDNSPTFMSVVRKSNYKHGHRIQFSMCADVDEVLFCAINHLNPSVSFRVYLELDRITETDVEKFVWEAFHSLKDITKKAEFIRHTTDSPAI